ncbi:hypothetical protein [Roseibium sediminicola]|uniref:Uncharacterized protein n=1 Tax=Roseibium sediminicola TaxID=2933272 RepID=A0ABT0GYB6_9HYPH|nr:hypothetical protein [Roseibium sp. CAU 1639]MCK7614235.1 hypothetical protein [Roseibium sp. CAU 1639]
MTGPRKVPMRIALPKDPLFRLLAINGLAGIGIAGLVLGGIFAANIGNLRDLVLAADNPVLPVVMLAFALVITLGSVVIGSAIMLLGETGGQGGGSGKRRPIRLVRNLRPIPVTAPAQVRRGLHR